MSGRQRAVFYAVLGFLVLALAVLAVRFIPYSVPSPVPAASGPVRTVSVKGEVIRVAVADTEALREQGLSGREGLAPDEGMLFIFPKEGTYAFWMKDMRFSIDIVWLSASGAVVDVAADVSPETYPHAFTPKSPARYVIELPAGWAKAHMLRIGDIVRL